MYWLSRCADGNLIPTQPELPLRTYIDLPLPVWKGHSGLSSTPTRRCGPTWNYELQNMGYRGHYNGTVVKVAIFVTGRRKRFSGRGLAGHSDSDEAAGFVIVVVERGSRMEVGVLEVWLIGKQHSSLPRLTAVKRRWLAPLYDLHELHTFTMGVPFPHRQTKGGGNIGFVELAYCLARWPALKFLGVFNFSSHPGMTKSATLRLPICALTKLVMKNTRLSDRELMHIMSSSLKTLEQAAFDTISGVTNACIRISLDAISHSLTSLSIFRTPVRRDDGAQDERALDATIDKMLRLRSLDIGGDVATELMLQRRTKLFIASRSDGSLTLGSAIPVIQLSLHQVPGIPVGVAEQDWPGWKISRLSC
ncbi:hypothetical protein BU15DRAFT_69204 [Melanogaster broomeanus]|nr:hypothetical protein BU15DRAFT_69204 [Melanogaster broomeanus]